MRKGRSGSPMVGESTRTGRGGIPRSVSPAEAVAKARAKGKSGTPEPTTRGVASRSRTPLSRTKSPGSSHANDPTSPKPTPRTPLTILASSPNVAHTPSSNPNTSFGSDRTLSPGWGLFQGGDDTPGLSDSVVSEQADFLVEQIARGGIADDDLREELRSALKARRENTALRDHIERIKNEEVGMGLEASKRMAELSAEYMSQVDELKKEKEAARERAEAAEEEAKMLAEMMRANGFATPPGAGLLERAMAGANASTATTSTPIAGPAALAFASPVVYDQSLDCLMTPTGDFVFPGSGDSGGVSGLDLAEGAAAAIKSVGETPDAPPASSSFSAKTPSSDAAQGAAMVAMASMDHPTLVKEASQLVAANVRLERERRALVERLESVTREAAAAASSNDAFGITATPAKTDRPVDGVLPGTPGSIVLTPGGSAVDVAALVAFVDAFEVDGAAGSPPPGAPESWEMRGTSRAVDQLTGAIEKVKRAANEAVSLLDPEGDVDTSAASTPGGSTLNRALHRMKQKAGVDPVHLEKRSKAHGLVLEVTQAAALAVMQRDHLAEVLASEREQAKVDAQESLASLRQALKQQRLMSSNIVTTPNSAMKSVTIGDAIITPRAAVDTSQELTSAPAGDASELISKLQREIADMRRKIASDAAKTEHERTELQYMSAEHERNASRLTAELEAATKAAEVAQDMAVRRQKQAASLEAKHTRLSMELSATLQKLHEMEREALAEERKLSLSFRLNEHRGGVISDSPLVGTPDSQEQTHMTLVGTPLDLPLIKTATKASPDSASSERSRSRADSPLVFSSLVRKVSATRSAVEAALAVAKEKEAEPAVDKDETAALVEELRTQLEAARAEVSDVHARLIAAEEKADVATMAAAAAEARVKASMKSPSPSPISAIENSPVVQDHVEEGVDEVSDNLGLDGDTYFKDQDDDVSPESQRRNLSDAREAVTAAEAALTWARRGEAAAQAEADAERKLAAAARAEAAASASSLENVRSELVVARATATTAANKLAATVADAENIRAQLAAAQAAEVLLAEKVDKLQEQLVEATAARDETERLVLEECESLRAQLEEKETELCELKTVTAPSDVTMEAEEALRTMAAGPDDQEPAADADLARIKAELDATRAQLADARAETERVNKSMRQWKDQQTAAVARWREEASARTAAAEAAAAAANAKAAAAQAEAATAKAEAETASVIKHGDAHDPSSIASLLAENRELIAEAERHASQYEMLEVETQELRARCEAAEESAADAPQLRAENYDLAVKHRAGLQRLHDELSARRQLEDRVEDYERATARLEATVGELEIALKEAQKMCAAARSASISAASDRAASEAAAALMTPAKGVNSQSFNAESSGGSSSSPAYEGQATVAALAAAEAAKSTLSKAVEAAERATGEAREEAAQARAEAASAKQEAEALRVTAEQRRADLAVLRDECQSLRMKVLDMEEDARLSPSPRKGGMRLMNGDSPFSSMKAYSRLVEDDAKQANDPDATALSISADTPMRSPAMIPAEGGSMQALALTPPASDNVEEEKKAAASVKKLAVSLRSKAEMLLAASSGASVAIEGSSSVAGLNQHDHLTHSVSELVQTEAWLDQVIATTDRIRHENQTLKEALTEARKMAEDAFEAAQAVCADAEGANDRCIAAEARATAAESRADELESATVESESALAEARTQLMQVKDDFTKMSAAQFEELRKKNVELAEAQEARRVAEAASVKMASEVAASSPLSLTIRKPASTALAVSPSTAQFGEALRTHTVRLKDDVLRAQAEVAAHKEHAKRMQREIALLQSDVPSARARVLEQQQLRLGSSSDQNKLSVSPAAGTNIPPTPPPIDVEATTAANTAANTQASSRAVYYKSIAKKCYTRMKQQKDAYELQIAGLRKQLEFVSNGSVNMTNLSFASTVAGGPSPARGKHGVRFRPDVDDATLLHDL